MIYLDVKSVKIFKVKFWKRRSIDQSKNHDDGLESTNRIALLRVVVVVACAGVHVVKI